MIFMIASMRCKWVQGEFHKKGGKKKRSPNQSALSPRINRLWFCFNSTSCGKTETQENALHLDNEKVPESEWYIKKK